MDSTMEMLARAWFNPHQGCIRAGGTGEHLDYSSDVRPSPSEYAGGPGRQNGGMDGGS